MGSPLATNTFEIEIPSLPRVRRKILESEPKTCVDEADGNNKRLIDIDDLSCDITLKELRGRSKKKKKLESVGMKMQNISEDSHFGIKQEPNIRIKKEESDIKRKEEEFDFEKPLIAWKHKGSNKANAKRKNRKQVNSSLESGVPVEEVMEQVCIGSEDSSSQTSNIDEMHKSGSGGDACITEETCIISEASSAKTSNIDEMHINIHGSDIESISLAKDSSLPVINEASFEYTRLSEPMESLGERLNFGEIINMGFSHAINDSLPSVFELTKEGDVKSNTNHKLENAFPVGWDLGSVVRESCKEYFYQTQGSSPVDCDATMQPPENAIYGTAESKELSEYAFDVKGKVFSDRDTSTLIKETIAGNVGSPDNTSRDSYLSPNPHNGGDHEYHGSIIAEKDSVYNIEEPMSVGTDGVGESLSMTSVSDRTGFYSAEVFKSQNSVQADCVPKRLLSTRKAISPTSQERLRQAMDIDELYSSLGNARSGLKGAAINICAGQVDIKSKNAHETSQPVPKSILKSSLVTVGTPPLDGNGISSISPFTQKAVAFSQRQMQDIESLTVKLMKELKSMKSVVEESLHSREYSTPPKYTIDETRVAIQNAAEVEETTKRWLSMMARDCNRFCKIMRSSGKTSAAAAAVAEKKKITFADEAGGVLCHVKYFEGDDTASVSSPEAQRAQ